MQAQRPAQRRRRVGGQRGAVDADVELHDRRGIERRVGRASGNAQRGQHGGVEHGRRQDHRVGDVDEVAQALGVAAREQLRAAAASALSAFPQTLIQMKGLPPARGAGIMRCSNHARSRF